MVVKSGKSVWKMPDPVQVSPEISGIFPGFEVISQLLVYRGLQTRAQAMAYLYTAKYSPCNPFELPDMHKAVTEMIAAINEDQKIGIWGDFDADGQTSTAILFEGIKRLTNNIIYRLPVRKNESHGISHAGISDFVKEGVNLLITCDTGVSEIESIQYGLENGIRTIITDHHTLPEVLPDALAIVNPERLDPSHPLRHLSGAGVAYKFIEALYQESGLSDDLTKLLDITAIGIIADLVPLIGETRYLAQMGIKILQNTARPGLMELLKTAGIENDSINEDTISYLIAPRLNSLGRIGDASPVIELLTTKDPTRAAELAKNLDESNNERKGKTDIISRAAQNLVENDRELQNKPVLVLENREWDPGVIGIVASHLADVFRKPVAIISISDEKTARCSVRSVEGIDVMAALVENQQYLLRFGGHPMAAGFSIETKNLPAFKRAFTRSITNASKELPEVVEYQIDAVLPLEEVANASLVEKLEMFRPFGSGNPRFTFFAPNLRVVNDITFGKESNHRKLTVQTQSGKKADVLWWKGERQRLPDEFIDLLYQLRTSTYKGNPTVQIEYIDSKPHNDLPAALSKCSISLPFEVIDLRTETKPLDYINKYLSQEITEIFAEGLKTLYTHPRYKNRLNLQPSQYFAILSPPPNRAVLRQVLLEVKPEKIWLFSAMSEFSNTLKFLNHILKRIKTSIDENKGWIDIEITALETGHLEETIRTAVDYFVEKTTLEYIDKHENRIRLGNFGHPGQKEATILNSFNILWEETAAFRRYYQKAEINQLFSGLTSRNAK